jgi:hypothetical protein
MDSNRPDPDPVIAAEIARQAADHERFAFDDAAYVLGALSEQDRTAYEEHLRSCPLCQSEIVDLRDMPDLLGKADPAAWTAEQPPDTLLPRLLREVQRDRRRRALRTATIGLAAACLVALLSFAAITTWRSDHAPRALVMQGAQVPLHATVTLLKSKSGTTIKLTCSYDAPQPYVPATPGAKQVWYRMLAYNRAGDPPTDLGSWPSPKPGEDIELAKMMHWRASDIAKIEVTRVNGEVVLWLNL